jgi:hypothetical protein
VFLTAENLGITKAMEFEATETGMEIVYMQLSEHVSAMRAG